MPTPSGPSRDLGASVGDRFGERWDDAADQVEDAANSEVVHGLARLGLIARALVYLLVGVLAALLALGLREGEADQRGAMEELSRRTGGEVLIWLVAVGLFGYALWRLKEAAFGVVGDGDGAGVRLKSLARCLIYVALGVSAVQVGIGVEGSQSGQFEGISAALFEHRGGQTLVGVVGVVVAICGGVLVFEGVTRRFEKYLALAAMTPRQRATVEVLGVVGSTARGLVIALAGVLVVVAAVRAEPGRAGGLDQALHELAATTIGSVLLLGVAAGLVVFGLFGLAEARWRHT